MRRKWFIAMVAATLLCSCENGCEGGPFERGVRAALDGWDMWATPAVRPYEAPMPMPPEGAVPTEGRASLAKGQAELSTVPLDQRADKAALAYRRYCHHCHGPNGAARIIVGESHEHKPPDLRSGRVQAMSDAAIFEHIRSGGELMIPLSATLSPLEMLLVIGHVRSLEGRPARPYYKPQFTEPIR